MKNSICSISLICVAAAAQLTHAVDHSQFRGPLGNGVYDSSFPTNWSDTENVRWSVELPGGGWSSPVSVGGKIFVTTAVSEGNDGPKGFGDGVRMMGTFYSSAAPSKPFSFEVHCLNAQDGSTIWKKSVASKIPRFKIHPSNSYATESPVTDGKNVYAYFASVGVVASLNSEGDVLWTRDVGAYKTGNDFGTGSSLALHNGNLFVQCDNEDNSFLCALDAATGKDAWRIERESRTSWSSPILWKNKLRTELIVCGTGTVTSYDPESGKQNWRLAGTGGAYSASPTCDSERLYLGQSGRNNRGPLMAINAGAEGEMGPQDIGPSKVAWSENNAAPGMCSPVVLNNRVYVLSRGIISCHDAATGKLVYKSRMKNSSSVTASLWASGDKVYALNETGVVSVIKAGDKFELIGTNTIPGLYWSTPTATSKALLVREAGKLHCVAQ